MPAGQLPHTLESKREYEPAGQVVQLEAPAELYEPAEHGWQLFAADAGSNAVSEWRVGPQERDMRTAGVCPTRASVAWRLAARRECAWLTGCGGHDRGVEQREQEPGEGGDEKTRTEDHLWR